MSDTALYLRRAASSGLLNSVASAASVAIVLPLIIANIGFDAYGYWAILGAFVGIAGLFDLGMSKALVFLIPADPAAESDLASGAVAVCVALTLVAVIVFLALVAGGVAPLGPAVARHPELTWWLAIPGAAILVCQVCTTLIRALLEARRRAHVVNTGFAVSTVAYYGVALVLSQAGADVRVIVAASASVFALNLAAHLHLLALERPVHWRRPSAATLARIGGVALRTFAVDVPAIAYLPIMLWVFLALAPTGGAYGAFDLATRIAILCATALSTLAVPFYALVAGARAGDGAEVRRLLDRFVFLLLGLAAAGWIAFCLVGEPLLEWWMPDAPPELAAALRVLLAGCLLHAALEPATRLLLGLGHMRRLLAIRLCQLGTGAVLVIALGSMPVLPRFSIAAGAGWAMAALLLAAALWSVRWGRETAPTAG